MGLSIEEQRNKIRSNRNQKPRRLTKQEKELRKDKKISYLKKKGEKYSKELLQNKTESEEIFCGVLDHNYIDYQEQVPIPYNHKILYIVDFLIDKIVVEVDGGYHNTDKQKKYDKVRSKHLRKLGYRIVRIKNEELLNNFHHVRNRLIKAGVPIRF